MVSIAECQAEYTSVLSVLLTDEPLVWINYVATVWLLKFFQPLQPSMSLHLDLRQDLMAHGYFVALILRDFALRRVY